MFSVSFLFLHYTNSPKKKKERKKENLFEQWNDSTTYAFHNNIFQVFFARAGMKIASMSLIPAERTVQIDWTIILATAIEIVFGFLENTFVFASISEMNKKKTKFPSKNKFWKFFFLIISTSCTGTKIRFSLDF